MSIIIYSNYYHHKFFYQRCNLHTDAIIVQKLRYYRVQNDMLTSMDNQRVTMLLLLDLSAALDTVRSFHPYSKAQG